MTENEAIKEIVSQTCEGCYGSDEEPNVCKRCGHQMAMDALKEIQQYRAIGTVERFRFLQEVCDLTGDELEHIANSMIERKNYRAIGTIEEFKALKEEVELYRNLDKTNFSDGYNKAIDEFADELINHSICADIGKGNEVKMGWVSPVTRIEKVREQMKGGTE